MAQSIKKASLLKCQFKESANMVEGTCTPEFHKALPNKAPGAVFSGQRAVHVGVSVCVLM